MSATLSTDRDRFDCSAGTLGDLLYADKSKPFLREEQWVGLVRSSAARDQVALHALYERMHRVVFTLIMRITDNRETAEELTLDVFYDVWRRAPQYDAAGGSVVGWIVNQAHSRAIDRVRFEHRKKRDNPDADQRPPAISESDSAEVFELMQQGQLLRNALTVLTPDERHVIEIAFFSELTYAEVATRLNQPLGSVKTRIRSGLGKLRQALATGVKQI